MPQTTPDKRSYKQTLNLPKTAFAMKANLVQNEPQSQKRWEAMKLYDRLREQRRGAAKFSFHDGPPYANGSIHLGHLLNKVLKDLVVRTRTMMGFDVPYVPGWDCHGLPIEHKVVQELGDKAREMEPIQIRRKCKAYAEKFIKLQSKQMQRLLTLGDYADPYLTMTPQYEADELEVFARLIEAGIVYRGLKPVHWSIENRTALADAELEYYDREDTSVYVRFDRTDGEGSLMIWTTTPWTLPANLAVAVNERFDYGLYQAGEHKVILATELAARVLAAGGCEASAPIRTWRGSELVGVEYRHPFVDRTSRVVAADYVTLEDGTGLVHTAPGHGSEDYQTGLKEGLDVYCPVRADGTFDDSVPDWLRGLDVWQGNGKVVEHLRESGHLFHDHTFSHSYPHDWRGKTPTIFRATEQWFVDVDKAYRSDADDDPATEAALRSRAIGHVENHVKFYPGWGRNRLRGMLETRPDWCISRQRSWGLPIPAFLGPKEGQVLLTAASVRAVAQLIAEKGSDVWFLAEPHDLLTHYDPAGDGDAPQWVAEAIHGKTLRRATDIFDVWFDSGSSWNAVIRRRFGDAAYPADLYVEGSDQHRGWFQTSLLLAVGATGQPPFRSILTHGFMVDKDGKKMSKSLGNALEVEELLKKYGADVCRWWVASLNTDNDIKVDDAYFKVASDEYRKVRNTIRFLLSNLGDFNANAESGGDLYSFVAGDAQTIDGWALGELDRLVREVTQCYETYRFRKASELLFNFCNDTLSAIYLAAVKDRLYCDAADSTRRRRTQTTIYRIADGLIRLLAPILPHTADEAWTALHGSAEGVGAESVHLVELPKPVAMPTYDGWPQIMEQRDRALKLIEETRESQDIDNPLDLGLKITFNPRQQHYFENVGHVDLADLLGISQVALESVGEDLEQPQMQVLDLRDQARCERSWKRDGTVKQRSDGGWLTDRDAEAVGV